MDDIMVQNDVLDTAKMEGLEEGRAEGRAEGIQEIIMSMLKANMSIEQIASIAGLPKEKIQEIAKSEELK